jgi:hypothetical protein
MLARFGLIGQWLWTNTDGLTKWLQVLAVIFAAVWTYLRFQTSEAPSLKTPLSVSSVLRHTWRGDPDPGSCWVETVIEVRNLGITSFDVGSVRLRTWRKNLEPSSGKLEFVDFTQIEKDGPTSDMAPQSLIIGRYAPKTEIHDAFTWIYNGKPEPGLYIFMADVVDKRGSILGSAASWTDRLCR